MLVARGSRLRLRDLEEEGRQVAAGVRRKGADRVAAGVSREAGEDPGVGRTEKAVTGFRSRAGRTFRAKLRLEQTDEAKWRVEFDEEWAKEPPKGESEEERAEREAGGAAKPAEDAVASEPAEAAEAAESETAAPAA